MVYDRDLDVTIGFEPRARPIPRLTIERERCGCAYRVSTLAHLSTRTLLRQCRKHRLADALQDLWIDAQGLARWWWREQDGKDLLVGIATAAVGIGLVVATVVLVLGLGVAMGY